MSDSEALLARVSPPLDDGVDLDAFVDSDMEPDPYPEGISED